MEEPNQKVGRLAKLKQIIVIGVPAVIESIISGLPSDQTAVYSVTMILLSYSFSFGDGLQAAVLTLTGQKMGARQYWEVKDYVRLSQICWFIMSCVKERRCMRRVLGFGSA